MIQADAAAPISLAPRKAEPKSLGLTASAALFIVLCVSYGGVGKDLLHNPVRTGDADDPFALLFNFVRYGEILVCLSWMLSGGMPKILRVFRTIRFVLPYGIVTILSLAWSADPPATFRYIILFNGFLMCVAVLLENLGPLRIFSLLMHFLAVVVIASTVTAVLFPSVGRHDPGDMLFLTLVGKWRGIFAHKNTLASYAGLALAMLLPFGTMMKAPKAYLLLARLCALTCLVMAGSANAVLGVIVMFATYALLVRREFANGLVLSLATVVALGVAAIGSSSLLAELLGRDESFSGRTLIWEVALTIWRQSPLLGFGYIASQVVTVPILQSALFESAVDVHSAYIDTLLDTGIIGLTILLAGFVLTLRIAVGVLRQSEGQTRQVLLGGLMLMVGNLAMGFGEVTPLRIVSDGYMTFFGALLMARLPDLWRGPKPRIASLSRRPRTPATPLKGRS